MFQFSVTANGVQSAPCLLQIEHKTFETREAWLLEATSRMRRDLFERSGNVVPKVKVSVGFPGGGSARTRIGEHWHPRATQDNVSQIFISPVLDSPLQALETLVHELVHAIVPDAKHGPEFGAIAKRVGLVGKMTATIAGPNLKLELETMINQLGKYPHAGINVGDRKKQSTRLMKVECGDCGYIARVSSKWIDEAGAPICPCNGEAMVQS
jgi:hypothetical protein